MPELPEVETVRRQLEPILVGRTFERVEIADARLVRPYDPVEVAAELSGERVAAVERRGKYLVVRFESGRVLLVHLRMTGSFHSGRRGSLQDVSHRRAVVTLENGSDVAYRDVRRFGTWLLLEPGELEPYLGARVGPEPLGPRFTTAFLRGRLAGRAAPLKAAVLDQRTAAGLGNIYADEAALPSAAVVHEVQASRTGYVGRLTALPVGLAALHLGAGRREKDDAIDHAVGIVCRAKRGDAVAEGETLAEVHARDPRSAREAGAEVLAAYELVDEPPRARPIVLDTLG